jgi:hypothetical protein
MFVDIDDYPSLKRFYAAEPKLLIRRVISRQDRVLAAYASDAMVFKKDINPFVITDAAIPPLYLLAVVNSRLFSYLYVNASTIALKDDFRQTTLAELRRMPIPRFAKADSRCVNLAASAKQLSDAYQRLSAKKTAHERVVIERQITRLEVNVDSLVYDLYGVSPSELRLIQHANPVASPESEG